MAQRSKNRINLTEGPIFSSLLRFAIPILLGSIVTQLYNVADSVIVGRFVSSDALAAVSASSPVRSERYRCSSKSCFHCSVLNTCMFIVYYDRRTGSMSAASSPSEYAVDNILRCQTVPDYRIYRNYREYDLPDGKRRTSRDG